MQDPRAKQHPRARYHRSHKHLLAARLLVAGGLAAACAAPTGPPGDPGAALTERAGVGTGFALVQAAICDGEPCDRRSPSALRCDYLIPTAPVPKALRHSQPEVPMLFSCRSSDALVDPSITWLRVVEAHDNCVRAEGMTWPSGHVVLTRGCSPAGPDGVKVEHWFETADGDPDVVADQPRVFAQIRPSLVAMAIPEQSLDQAIVGALQRPWRFRRYVLKRQPGGCDEVWEGWQPGRHVASICAVESQNAGTRAYNALDGSDKSVVLTGSASAACVRKDGALVYDIQRFSTSATCAGSASEPLSAWSLRDPQGAPAGFIRPYGQPRARYEHARYCIVDPRDRVIARTYLFVGLIGGKQVAERRIEIDPTGVPSLRAWVLALAETSLHPKGLAAGYGVH